MLPQVNTWLDPCISKHRDSLVCTVNHNTLGFIRSKAPWSPKQYIPPRFIISSSSTKKANKSMIHVPAAQLATHNHHSNSNNLYGSAQIPYQWSPLGLTNFDLWASFAVKWTPESKKTWCICYEGFHLLSTDSTGSSTKQDVHPERRDGTGTSHSPFILSQFAKNALD